MSTIHVLRNFGKESHIKRCWNKLWTQIGERIQALPEKEQKIILEDILTAINSRLYIFEHILGEKNENRNLHT